MTDTHTTSHIPDEAVQAAAKRSYEYEGDRKGLLYVGFENEPEDTQEQWRNSVKEAILGALPHLSAPCAVEAKKLEWVQDCHGSIEFTAQSMFGEYSVHIERKSAYACSLDGVRYEHININHPYTVDQAKAAAQADFERRVISCVVTKPVDVSAVRRQAFEEGFENGVEQSLNALYAYDDITRNEAEQGIRKLKPDYRALSAEPAQGERKYKLGDRLTKTRGAKWTGRVVGFYSTNLTPIGYAIESETETGSVQIYPEAALTLAHSVDAGRAALAKGGDA